MDGEALKQYKKSNLWINAGLLILVILLALVPLYIARGSEFEGADTKAQEAISEIKSDYEPWFSPFFEPPSGEIESLLFALQAGLGAGVIGYGLGYFRGKRDKRDGDGK